MEKVGDRYELQEEETAQALLDYEDAQTGKLYLITGSAIIEANEFIPKQGRILALEVNASYFSDEGGDPQSEALLFFA